MRKFYFALIFFLCVMLKLQAQNVNVTATAGTINGSYATLKAAFDAINIGTHQGAISISIVAATVETATAQLNANTTPAAYTSINISPTTSVSVSASIASSLINLNGATNVTINGNNQLTLNNNTAGGNVLSFSASASNNVVKNTTILGVTTSATSGIIFFGTAGSGNGNDNNTLDNIIVDGQSLALNLLLSSGTTTTSTTQNSGDTIRNSIFRNVSTAIASPVFLWLNAGNTGWVIQNNSLYQTATANLTVQGAFTGILVFPNYSTDAHVVRNNFIGGNATGAAGIMQLNGTGSNAVGFQGISIQTGGSGNVIKQNVVRNIAVSYNSTAGTFSNVGIFAFIGGYDGTTIIDSNKVDNITISNSSSSAFFYGIHCNGRVTAAGATVLPTFFITSDTVSNITLNAGGTGSVTLYGQRLETSSLAAANGTSLASPLFFSQNNLVTNLSTSFGSASTVVRGITTVNTTTSTTAPLWPWCIINNNTISNLSTAGYPNSYNTAGGFGPAVSGIHFGGSSVTINNVDIQDISQNNIYNLTSNSLRDSNTTSVGIFLTNGIYEVYRNKVYDIKNKATGSLFNPGIIGINLRANFDTSLIYNNMISVGNGETSNTQVFGILNNFNASAPISTYFNSINITGTGGGGNTKNSAAILRGTDAFATGITTPFDIVNNILYNVRTGGTGKHYTIANTNAIPATGFTSDSNDLYTLNPSTVANWGGADNDLATYKANASDGGSKSFPVTFVDANNGDLHLAGASIGDFRLEGTPIPGITTDYDGQARNDNPYIGADEIIISPLPVTMDFFNGRKQSTGNMLSWKASCSSPSITFEIERSTDGRRFSDVGSIHATQARCDLPFNYMDASPAAGMNYYRLKMTEADGALKYSTIIAILNKTNGFELVGLYPTLVQSDATLSITSADKTMLQVRISDLTGRPVIQKSIAVAEGSALIRVDLSTLAKGVYHLTGTTPDGYEKTIRFLKQ